jgi:hypothetical protein
VREDPNAGACDWELILQRLQSRIGHLDVAAAGARFWGLLAGTDYGLSNANYAQFKIDVRPSQSDKFACPKTRGKSKLKEVANRSFLAGRDEGVDFGS